MDAIKYKLYPTPEQEKVLKHAKKQYAWAYNFALTRFIDASNKNSFIPCKVMIRQAAADCLSNEKPILKLHAEAITKCYSDIRVSKRTGERHSSFIHFSDSVDFPCGEVTLTSNEIITQNCGTINLSEEPFPSEDISNLRISFESKEWFIVRR